MDGRPAVRLAFGGSAQGAPIALCQYDPPVGDSTGTGGAAVDQRDTDDASSPALPELAADRRERRIYDARGPLDACLL